jgi:hypothetical protein
MKTKTLKQDEKKLLLHCLQEHNPELLKEVTQLEQGLLEKRDVRQIIESIGDELMAKGFQPDGEPNKYGLELEDLIGKLSNLYLWPEKIPK